MAVSSQIPQSRSGSVNNPTYWWYRARSNLLERFGGRMFAGTDTVVDVGSADGPSVGWLAAKVGRRVPIDIDLESLGPGGVCANALRLPFANGALTGVVALDVVEHFSDDVALLREFHRVTAPQGHLLLSVPAYQWAWSDFDVRAGHHRRYTRRSLVRSVRAAGYRVDRVTHAFAATLPVFALQRLLGRLRGGTAGVRPLPRAIDTALYRLCAVDQAVLARADLPFGSSIFLAATRVETASGSAGAR